MRSNSQSVTVIVANDYVLITNTWGTNVIVQAACRAKYHGLQRCNKLHMDCWLTTYETMCTEYVT